MKRVFMIGVLVAASSVHQADAQETELSGKDESAIRATGEAYVKAFNSRDAEAVAAFWSPEAVYVNRLTREQVVGRKAIAAQFTSLFQSTSDLKLAVDVASIQFVSPNVAVEHGVAKFLSPKDEPEKIDHSAVYVGRDGKWLLDRVTDDPGPVVQSHYMHLKELESCDDRCMITPGWMRV